MIRGAGRQAEARQDPAEKRTAKSLTFPSEFLIIYIQGVGLQCKDAVRHTIFLSQKKNPVYESGRICGVNGIGYNPELRITY